MDDTTVVAQTKNEPIPILTSTKESENIQWCKNVKLWRKVTKMKLKVFMSP